MATEAQRRARNKWNKKNKAKQKIYNYRSNAKSFIKDFATNKDIEELEKLLQERKQTLKDQAEQGNPKQD